MHTQYPPCLPDTQLRTPDANHPEEGEWQSQHAADAFGAHGTPESRNTFTPILMDAYSLDALHAKLGGDIDRQAAQQLVEN